MGSFSIWHWLIVLLVVVVDLRHQEAEEHRRRPGWRGQGLQGRRESGGDDRRRRRAAPPCSRSAHRRPPNANTVDVEAKTKSCRWHSAGGLAPLTRMIDFGFDKIALIGAVALIVIGPEKLPRVARTVGHLLGKAQRYVADVKAEVNRSIELEELKKMKTQFEDAARDVEKTVGERESARPRPTSTRLAGGDLGAAGRERPA